MKHTPANKPGRPNRPAESPGRCHLVEVGPGMRFGCPKQVENPCSIDHLRRFYYHFIMHDGNMSSRSAKGGEAQAEEKTPPLPTGGCAQTVEQA